MPPRYLRKGSTKLKSCSEFKVEACDIAPADQCCGALPCRLCLELDVYGEPTAYGTATFGGSSWTGTVGGLAFVSYWEKNYEGECEYVVTLDGEEVYRATCYEGASCRDPGGSVGVTIGYDEGTLSWAKHEPRPLAVVVDPDTGCNDFFCGTCRCTCDCLCVTITEPDGTVMLGEICSTSYPCDAPVWEGSIGYYDLSIALGRDQYTGECIISLTASGEDADPVFVSGCADMSASVTMYDGTVISVRCKQCSCEETDSTLCCTERCNPYISEVFPGDCTGDPGENPLPTTLTVEMTTDASTGCFSATTTVTLLANGRWGNGDLSSTCLWHNPVDSTAAFVTWYLEMNVFIQCATGSGWGIEFRAKSSDNNPRTAFIPADSTLAKVSCDPILLQGTVCFDSGMSSVVFPAVPPQPPLRHPIICLSFLVYETP